MIILNHHKTLLIILINNTFVCDILKNNSSLQPSKKLRTKSIDLQRFSKFERRCFTRGRLINVMDIMNLIFIVWLQQSWVIHYCIQQVLLIALDQKMLLSVFSLLISSWKAPWYGIVYYMWAINTTWRNKCATFIRFTTFTVKVSYQYTCSSCYCEIHLLRLISCYFNSIYTEYLIILCFVNNY